MADRYCKPGDLLLGDLTVDDGIAQKQIDGAADEIDGELGAEYIIPFNLDTLAAFSGLRIKRICVLIASGRFLLAQAGGSEDIHAYGRSLLKEGQNKLAEIKMGNAPLVDAPTTERVVDGTAPSIIQGDTTSGVDAFYAQTGRKDIPGVPDDFWRPGT